MRRKRLERQREKERELAEKEERSAQEAARDLAKVRQYMEAKGPTKMWREDLCSQIWGAREEDELREQVLARGPLSRFCMQRQNCAAVGSLSKTRVHMTGAGKS